MAYTIDKEELIAQIEDDYAAGILINPIWIIKNIINFGKCFVSEKTYHKLNIYEFECYDVVFTAEPSQFNNTISETNQGYILTGGIKNVNREANRRIK